MRRRIIFEWPRSTFYKAFYKRLFSRVLATHMKFLAQSPLLNLRSFVFNRLEFQLPGYGSDGSAIVKHPSMSPFGTKRTLLGAPERRARHQTQVISPDMSI